MIACLFLSSTLLRITLAFDRSCTPLRDNPTKSKAFILKEARPPGPNKPLEMLILYQEYAKSLTLKHLYPNMFE